MKLLDKGDAKVTNELPLHTKYRPKLLDEMYGMPEVIASLQSLLSRRTSMPHTFLFAGPSGCGKTTLARIIKNELNCADTEFLEYNASNTRGIDTIREIMASCVYKPLSGSIRIYLLDECHKLTNDAQNSLLKLLEDTPEHVFFILCTTSPDKLIQTIRGRCSSYHVLPLNARDMARFINDIGEMEGVEIPSTIISEISRVSDGRPRQALIALHQIIDMPDEESAIKALSEMALDEVTVADLCKVLIDKNKGSTEKWKDVSKMLKKLQEASEVEDLRLGILGYFNKIMLDSGNDKIAEMMGLFIDSMMYSGKGMLTVACWAACNLTEKK